MEILDERISISDKRPKDLSHILSEFIGWGNNGINFWSKRNPLFMDLGQPINSWDSFTRRG